jgi:O-antigen/teichoic acid export membrane protein
VAPATLSQIFAVIVWERSEVFFLERFSSIEQVGIYGVAYTMLTMSMYLGWALVNGFFPAISRDFGAGAWERVRTKFQQAAVLATLFAVPLSLGAWVTLERIIVLLYGSKMLPAVPVAQILMAGLLPAVFASVLGLAITAVGGIWLHVRMGFLMSALNIALAIALIPHYGAIGAALSNTLSQCIHVSILVVLVHRRYGMKLPAHSMAQVIAVGLMTTFIAPLIIQSMIPGTVGLLAALLIAGCSYALSIWLLGFFQILQGQDVAPIPGSAGE